MRNLTMAQVARDAVYLCAACMEDGIVRISAIRKPEGSIRRRPGVVAAQWAWVGSESRGKQLVRRLRRQWVSRYVLGEGYRFDYGSEGDMFRNALNAAFRDVVKASPQWEKLGPESLMVLKSTRAGRSWLRRGGNHSGWSELMGCRFSTPSATVPHKEDGCRCVSAERGGTYGLRRR